MDKKYIYHRYGSIDSTNTDVVLFLNILPETQEERKNLTNDIKREMGVDWNMIIAKIEDGVIVDCTYPKSSTDSLNNAVFNTYKYHDQNYSLLIDKCVERNIPLAIYKTVRIFMSYLTRTEYRKDIRPYMHYSIDFNDKLNRLKNIDFTKIETFNQKNVNDIDVWKTLCFYIVQNTALLDGIEIYDKKSAIEFENLSKHFIYRNKDNYDKEWFQTYFISYLNRISKLDIVHNGEFLTYNNQKTNIRYEIN